MDLLIYLTSDIDECGSFYGCQEKCINTVSDYHWVSLKGYRPKDDKRTWTNEQTPVNPFSEFCIPVIMV